MVRRPGSAQYLLVSGYASSAGGGTDYFLPDDEEVGVYAETVAI